MPEVGDRDKPRLVFFFDEAHILFNEAPRPLMEKVEQVVRLIRSKGVGIYFCTQNPSDIPDDVLGQLGNRVQHALRAYTPRDQRAVKVAADTMRPNPAFDTAEAITQLGVGEALISFLDADGQPSVVERAFVQAPASRIGTVDASERKDTMRKSVVAGIYDKTEDRDSAYEKLKARADIEAREAVQAARGNEDSGGIGGPVGDILSGAFSGGKKKSGGRKRQGVFEAAAKSGGTVNWFANRANLDSWRPGFFV